jgi:mannitol-1-phosphate/altronate dehydrogenase
MRIGRPLVIPPARHLGGGRFERAHLDVFGGYFYKSDRDIPYAQHVNDFFTIPASRTSALR